MRNKLNVWPSGECKEKKRVKGAKRGEMGVEDILVFFFIHFGIVIDGIVIIVVIVVVVDILDSSRSWTFFVVFVLLFGYGIEIFEVVVAIG